MTDILYLEKSPLLTKKFIELFPNFSFILVKNEKLFFKELFQKKPFLIIVGDTGSLDPIELLFCLKGIKGYNTLPLFFYGEMEFSEILPVTDSYTRDPEDSEKLIKSLTKYLLQSKHNFSEEITSWPVPVNYHHPDFIHNRAQSLMKTHIFESFFSSEILGMNIVDLSILKVIEKIQNKICELLLADFVYMVLNDNKTITRSLYLNKVVSHEKKERIINICEEKDKTKDGRDNTKLKITVGSGKSQETGNEKILSNITLDMAKGVEGQLLIGSFSNKEIELSSRLTTKFPDMIARILEKAYFYYQKIDETQMIFQAFKQFLPAPIINDLLLKQSEKALMTGEKRNIVVLFAHIRKFDTMVELNTPDKVVNFLNQHFSNMVKIIQRHGGTIDKFIGDAVFAIFGAPISYEDNTERAARAAIEMIQSYKNISAEGFRFPDEGFSIGVGLNEGQAIIGNIGCSDKFDYTAIGDTVNLAARLESLTKHYHQDILISRIVHEKIHKEYYCRLVDKAKVKGKSKATDIFSLIVDPSPYTEKWKELYNRGLQMYILGNWHIATGYFENAKNILPDDFVCSLLLDRCEEFQIAPPETWDGAVELNFK